MITQNDEDFRASLVRLMPALRGYGRALGGSVATADELVQETLVRALGNDRRPEQLGELRAWLFTILRNAWLTSLRAGRRIEPLEEGMEPAEAGAGAQDHLALDDLARAMRNLPAPQREAVVLMGAQGLPAAEAARICGVAEGTMRARLSRARHTLRRTLQSRLRSGPAD